MSENEYDLLIDESDSPILFEEECKAVKPIVADFVKAYTENEDKPVETWLSPKMHELFPDRKPVQPAPAAEEQREAGPERFLRLCCIDHNSAKPE